MESACELFVRCLQGGGDEVWREFLDRCGRRIRATVLREMRRQRIETLEDDLDDFVQTFYLRLITRGSVLSPRSDPDFWGYMVRMARNLVIEDRRAAAAAKRCRPPRVAARCSWPCWEAEEHPPIPSHALSPEERFLRRERLTVFVRGCRQLLRGRRKGRLQLKILRLVYFEGMSSSEISGVLRGRVTPGQVDSFIHRLRSSLADLGVHLARRPYLSA